MRFETEADSAIKTLDDIEINLAPRIQPWSLQQAVRTNLKAARALIREWKDSK